MIRKIFNKIREYDKIIISRHIRPDGDATGSTFALRDVLRSTFPEKEIYLVGDDFSDIYAFLGSEDPQQSDEFYKEALLIVIDTATLDRISNSKYSLAKEIIKIDHHINNNPYGDIEWVIENATSSCEMVTDFCMQLKDELVFSQYAAKCLFAGLASDTGRFKVGHLTGETFRKAAFLADAGIDFEGLYGNMYMTSLNALQFKAVVLNSIKITENGVAYMYVDAAMQEKYGLNREEASACVSYMEGIRGSLIWLAFIDNTDEKNKGTIRVRLRSRFMTISKLAEKYRGGGHACASGATLYSPDEINDMLADADARIKEYKATHTDWV